MLRGIAFPFAKEKGQFPKMLEGEELISNNVVNLFKVPVRSRIMRPEVGSDVQSMIFDPIGAIFEARLIRSVFRSVQENEPRANVANVEVSTNNTMVTALVTYEVNGILKQQSLSVVGA
jgi:phage baseplate assembly protein W